MAPARKAREHGSVQFLLPPAMKITDVAPRLVLAGAVTLLAACQSMPSEEMSHARDNVANASLASLGSPEAPELARSRQKLALAHRWVEAGDYGPARWLAEQAEVDAELALARRASEQARLALAARERAGATRVSWQKP